VDGEPLRETSIVALSMSSAYFQLYDHRMGARTGSLVVALTLIGLALTLIWIDRTGPRKPRLVWSAGPYVLALPAVALEPVYAPIVATAAGLGCSTSTTGGMSAHSFDAPWSAAVTTPRSGRFVAYQRFSGQASG
jgi:hypothetical protein